MRFARRCRSSYDPHTWKLAASTLKDDPRQCVWLLGQRAEAQQWSGEECPRGSLTCMLDGEDEEDG
ncbi:hypothetical protein PGT21_025907 [Puccinia graminis f. sp. tritici]|uniref:Uncharacterized protein n=1 Tax=Puccinia graminis f. sp. tritici TaxID=56615 RepID=A0A5B0SAW5_PUCGR|nr:hypothetical protein PGT21_025907 [Puccinia graminis f. sp. tritici]KAA1135010.1 hypothetical protein PGTUg99_007532 [Puccinia graminis f. sp. tritici]